MKKIILYADTSVFGGCFDDEFSEESNLLFKKIANGEFLLVISTRTEQELLYAPEEVQNVLLNISIDFVSKIELSDEVVVLRDAYLTAGILGKASIADAEHIAFATIADADFIVSWNFKHIVHYDKIRAYQAINLLHGYKKILIYSPKEVV